MARTKFSFKEYVGFGFAGLILTAFALLFTVAISYTTDLTGRREAVGKPWTITVQSSIVNLVPLGSFEVVGVREAGLESSHGKKGSVTYRVVFDGDEGPTPMTWFYRGGRDSHQKVADDVNAQLKSPTATSFTYHFIATGWIAYVPVVIAGLTLLALVWSLLKWIFRTATAWPEEEDPFAATHTNH